MRALGVPVGRVLASPYCRTVETARLMNLGPVKTTNDVMNLRSAGYFGGRDAIVKRARSRLATSPAPGANTVIVAHGNVARQATPVYPGEGESVIFRPDGQGGFQYVGRLTPSEWVRLAENTP
jgi:broad specificity phosphatase PhoE